MANVSTATEADVEGRWEAVHPGEVLLEEFLQEWGVSQRRLALDRPEERDACASISDTYDLSKCHLLQ